MKARRHFAIMDIIASNRVATQEELCELLARRGFEVTQATVSRDIKELKLVKVPDHEGYRYALPESAPQRSSLERMKRMFVDSVISIEMAENLIVIRTLPGTAHAVAATIDTEDIRHVLGTVAGDDTILVIVRSRENVGSVVAFFRSLIE